MKITASFTRTEVVALHRLILRLLASPAFAWGVMMRLNAISATLKVLIGLMEATANPKGPLKAYLAEADKLKRRYAPRDKAGRPRPHTNGELYVPIEKQEEYDAALLAVIERYRAEGIDVGELLDQQASRLTEFMAEVMQIEVEPLGREVLVELESLHNSGGFEITGIEQGLLARIAEAPKAEDQPEPARAGFSEALHCDGQG